MRLRSNILKLCLLATGLAGVVAEYTLSTLATYFLGDSVFQFTMIVSIMLFSMGLGSRVSRFVKGDLLWAFVYIELGLSLTCSFVSILTYMSAAYSGYAGWVIYSLSVLVGGLVGMEIPIVIRLNDRFEELKVNVSAVMEKDYYGSLLGGVFFAFVGLPHLGLTYTPFILGSVNLLVAMTLLWSLWEKIEKEGRLRLGSASLGVATLIIFGAFNAKTITNHGEERRYKDHVVFSEQTPYQRIVMTESKDGFWLFINGNQQLSSLDEERYHEPLVHPALTLVGNPSEVLVFGGGDGCAVREILKYPSVKEVTVVDLDPAMTDLAKEHPLLSNLNGGALEDPRVKVKNVDGFTFLEKDKGYYDAVIIDLPDPKTVELGRLYSYEFYRMCANRMRPHGVVITQAGSPYYATEAFDCINKTMTEAGFSTAKLHNQVLTLGEWGWVLGTKKGSEKELLLRLRKLDFSNVKTQWINGEAMTLMTSFGKDIFRQEKEVGVNRIHDPILYRYYANGRWDMY
ncbi:polyamine aminopropyltransferase 2 [Fulvitalea axinellae]|uniref:Polyamine aminopropyltransferase n=1 Tax=Fulvitalea axinellae TaxID=1182444 RepID=A0AAU9C8V1_9BACT|nr:polyamine aminopropyltransferase 2 [Fulvitalea axinellae]